MRNTLAAAGTFAAAAALLLSGTAAAGAAQSGPARTTSLYAPSALVLTVSRGDDAATATVERAVTLNCAPKPTGSHPSPVSACAELRSVGDEFNQLVEPTSQRMCTRQWDPVMVTLGGVWQGKHVTWSTTFGNACEMKGRMADGTVFNF
ncbi:subtilase-type protease inhibitor [Streptomyces sp. H27-C3]|uniref:subtilase-type protease inhibitor n=1 Tax=Streptomyces sp. H27-C3 TaxID=3046305 RepID=UPI0024BA8C42|nr:subtilase-type protease inhibitor [Streptomyces sp. H27-C3]MDJ0464579.1 subtilase-type protease inhibitor [Streptomyces sp. H27-C3]